MAGLAASSAGAAAGFLANKIAILVELDEKLKAMAGTQRKMEKFKELSTTIDMVIQDVESHPSIGDAVKDLLKKLKYLSYDLEDVVDYYDTKIFQKKQRSQTSLRPVRDFFSSDNQLVFKNRVGGMIKAITESLDSILLGKSFLLSLPQNNIRMSEQSAYRETHSRNDFDVIGREPEKNLIVNMLTNDDESSHSTLKVIAIVGMGGLGKTTLAQFVFNDERVKVHFGSSRMWTVVGTEFDPVKIMKSVLEAATDAPVNISQIDSLRKKIEEVLSGKKFLLVLDDVWNEDPFKWGVLKAALTCGARGSKILVTTRNRQVSSIMGSSNTTHQIQQLSPDDCLSLFQQFAFEDQAVDQKLMEIGGKIVEKCGGVPFAALSLGNMLRGTRDETYWTSVLKSEIWQLRDEEQKVLTVLKWSYDTLPLQSKKCFAFGSLFSKNHQMEKDELIKLWIANGFMCSDKNFDAETLGNHVFYDLVKRSFFLLAPSRYGEHVITKCTMHDLMHDLARSVSADAYWNSYQDSVEDIGVRTYHLQIVEGKLPDMTQVLHKKPLYLRTFMLPYQNFSHFSIFNLHEVFSELKFLRALDLTGCGIREIPTSIGNLIHLRLLNLSKNEIEVLPDSITILFNLQYLNLRLNSELQKLPKELGNMQNLRELDLPRNCKLTHMPCGLSRLINLQSLPIFIAGVGTDACSILELEGLKLRGAMEIKISSDFKNYSHSGRKILKNADFNELCIRFECSAEKITSSVFANNSLLLYRLINDYINDYEVDRIESLRQWIPSFIAEETYHKDMLDDLCPNTSLKKLQISNYRSPQFPTWLIELQLPNLVEVDLSCFCKQIPPFQNLQSLEMLTFSVHGITHLGAEFHGSGGFPSLQQLCLNRMPDLEEWSESHGDDKFFPSLHSLKIFHCPKLKSMPTLPKIQNLDIQNCNSSLLSCIGRLTSLSVLQLTGMSEMTSLPSGCLKNLTSLTQLLIADCRELQSFPWDEIKHLEIFNSLSIEWCDKLSFLSSKLSPKVHYIRLYNCPSIILDPETFVEILNSVPYFRVKICGNKVNLCGRLQNLCSLKKLYLYGAHGRSFAYKDTSGRISNICICCCDELESLMIAEPTNNVLEELYIDRIPNLKTLPDWLQHLKSLRLLSIRNCPLLETVPSYLKDLRMLEDLMIVGCPQLESRCERETGEDWSIISKVSNVYVCSSDSAEHGEEFRRGGHRRSTPGQFASASDTAGPSHTPNQSASTSGAVGSSHAPSPPELSPLQSPVSSPRQSAAEMQDIHEFIVPQDHSF